MPVIRGPLSIPFSPKPWYPVWWLKHDFDLDAAAPLGSPYTGNGTGALVVADTNNKLSASGGKAVFATGGSGASNPSVWGAQQTRVTGRTVLGILTQLSQNFEFGWDSDQAGTTSYDVLRLNTSGSAIRMAGTAVDIGLILTGGPYFFALAQRSTGFWAFVRGSGIPSWKLVWVSATGTGNLYPTLQVGGTTTVANVDTFRGVDLGYPFTTDYGFATQRLSGARAANDPIIHDPNFIVEWTQTTIPSSGNTDLRFRMVDASNYIQVLVSSANALTINSVVAGVTTQIDTAASAVFAGSRVIVAMDGATLRSHTVTTLRASGTSSSFVGQSDGIISSLGTGGAVSDLITWPIYANSGMSQMLNMALFA